MQIPRFARNDSQNGFFNKLLSVAPQRPTRITITAEIVRIVKAGIDPLSTQGSTRFGGRYNRPGETDVLYGSFQSITAIAEVARHSTTPLSARWWQYTLRVEDVVALDLTDPAVLSRLRASKRALVGVNLDLPRRLAREAKDAGFQALIVPSAAIPEGRNVVLFLDTLSETPVLTASQPIDLRT